MSVNRHAILLTAYRHPEQVGRLARALRHPRLDVYVHVDRKIEEAPFLRDGLIPVENRVLVNWAGFGIVEASLLWLRQMRRQGGYKTHLMMSAQGFPIRPIGEIVSILDAQSNERVQIDHSDDDARWRWEIFHNLDRQGVRGWRDRFLKRFVHRDKTVRQLPSGLEHVLGSTYWVLGSDAVDWLLGFLDGRPEIVDFFRNTFAPDEMFYQMVMKASPFAQRLEKNLHYIDWSEGGAHPKLLGAEDFDRLARSGACFARKFDMDVDSAILDRIERELLQGVSLDAVLGEDVEGDARKRSHGIHQRDVEGIRKT